MSETCADCLLAPLTNVSMVVSADGGSGFNHRAERAKRVKALAARVLAVHALQIARGDVVQTGVAENVGPDVVRRVSDGRSGVR